MKYPLYKDYYKLDIQHIRYLINNALKNININKTKTKPKWIKYYIHKYNNPEQNNGATRIRLKPYYYLIEEKWEQNKELNSLTDYFTEGERIKCNFRSYLSPHDYFISNYNEISEIFKLENKNKHGLVKNLDIVRFKDYMFNHIKFCNNFRISIILTILNIFKPKKWLDISAGWGDRLISSLLYGVEEYFACDPNKDLQVGYNQIINTLCPDNKKNNFTIIPNGFENITIPHRNYDIIFTSPPFFDTEIYSTYESDSIIKYKTIDVWYDRFLLYSIKKAITYLSNDGYLILYMDFTDESYIQRLINDVNKQMKFLGCIYYYSDNKKLRPFYIWKY